MERGVETNLGSRLETNLGARMVRQLIQDFLIKLYPNKIFCTNFLCRKKIWKPVVISEWFPSPDHHDHHHHHHEHWDRKDAAADDSKLVWKRSEQQQATQAAVLTIPKALPKQVSVGTSSAIPVKRSPVYIPPSGGRTLPVATAAVATTHPLQQPATQLQLQSQSQSKPQPFYQPQQLLKQQSQQQQQPLHQQTQSRLLPASPTVGFPKQ